jgi:quercetin dioxygenase-like cupin family protein
MSAPATKTQTKRNYFVRAESVTPYSPKNHTGTVNRRLIGPETVGARQVEVVLGTVQKSHGALPHAHPGIEQVCYMLEGRALAKVDGQECELGPGDSCFFPADVPHVFTAVTDVVRVLVIYSPPYVEKGAVSHG